MYKKKMMPKKDKKRKPMMYGRTPMKKGKQVNNKIMYSMGGPVQKPN